MHFFGGIAYAVLISFGPLTAQSIEAEGCVKEKKIKVAAKGMSENHWVQFEDFRIDVGGAEEEYTDGIDKEAVRRVMIECMHGTVRCLRQNPLGLNHRKIIFAFNLSNENRIFPKVSHMKVDLDKFGSDGLRICLLDYWSEVRYPLHSKETQAASIRIPMTVRKTGALK
jgi:hypothetical protein